MPWKRFTDEEAVAFYRRFGQNIHYLRKQKAMSQDELAERVDCSQKYISKIELGQAKPSAVLLLKNRCSTPVLCGYAVYRRTVR